MPITVLTNPVLSDTTTFQDAPTENHGQSGLIAVDPRAFGWFSIDIPQGVTDASRISSAKLKFRTGQAATTVIGIFRANAAWSENTLTWNNKPTGTSIKSLASRAYSPGTTYEIDMTTEVKNFVSGTWANNGIYLTGTAGRLTVLSGENTDGSQVVLEITYDFPAVSVNYPAEPLLSSNWNSPTAAVSAIKNAKYNAQVGLLTALMPEPDVQKVISQVPFTELYRYVGNTLQPESENLFLGTAGASAYSAAIRVPNTVTGTVTKARLVLDFFENSSTGNMQVEVSKPNDGWSSASKPSTGPVQTISFVNATDVGKKVYIDLPVEQFNDGTAGADFFIAGFNSLKIFRSPTSTVGTKPYIELTSQAIPSVPVTFPAQPLVVDLAAYEAIATTTKTAKVNAEALAVSLSSPAATFKADKNAATVADYFRAELSMADATVEIVNPDVTIGTDAFVTTVSIIEPAVVAGVSVVADAGAVDPITLEMTDALFSNAASIKFKAQALLMNSKIVSPKVNGIDLGQFDDPFVNLIRGRVDGDDMWLRFRESTGTPVLYAGVFPESSNPAEASIYNYKYNAFGDIQINSDPGFHRSMAFNGRNDFLQWKPYNRGALGQAEDDLLYQGSIIFHIRVNDKNQVVYRSAGDSRTGSFSGRAYTTDVSLSDGKISITSDYNTDTRMIGIRDIADGQWHQVAITNAFQGVEDNISSGIGNAGTSIFIDGKLDRRTRLYIPVGKPDTIGKIDTRYFRGELSEIVHFSFLGVTKDFIEQAYYAFFDMNPIRVEPLGLVAAMGNNKARGNAKRILALHHRFLPPRAAYISPEGIDTKGLDTLWNDKPDNALIGSNAFVKYGGIYPPFEGTDNDINKSIAAFPGAMLSFQSIVFGPQGFWRDEVTDDPRYINLQTDIDIEDFDAIIVIDWPGINFVNRYRATPAPNTAQIFNDFVETIKKAVFDGGKELMINSPDMAKDLGLVKDFTSKKLVWESGYATSGYSSMSGLGMGQIPGDFYSAYNSPFTNIEAYYGRNTDRRRAIAEDTKAYNNGQQDQANGRRAYFDTHRGQMHRVAANLPGFTDLGGAALAEMTFFRRDTSDYKETAALSYRYLERPNGLQLGDEIFIEGPISENSKAAELAEISGPKFYNLISFKPEDINVGVAVFKEAGQVWEGTQLTANPSRENATLIAIDKGSVIDGRTINGKIIVMPNDYATFSEAQTVVFFQDLTKPNGFTQGDDYRSRPFVMPENEQTKKWQYSTWRFTNSRMDQISETLKVVSGRNGAAAIASNLTTFTSSVASPIDQYPVAATPVAMRAWNWLVTIEDELEEGDVRVRAETLDVNVISPEASTQAAKNTSMKAQPLFAQASLVRPDEDNEGENTVLAQPMTVGFSAPNTVTKFSVEPMTVDLNLPAPDEADRLDLSEVVYITFFGQQEIMLNRKDT